MSKTRRFWLKVKTAILLCLPLCFYIWMLRKVSDYRLQDYAGLVGENPKSLIVYNGIVMCDLDDMQI